MKKLYFIMTVLLCIGCYFLGTRKYYQAYVDAGHMSDLIRCYKDHLSSNEIQDYGCFEELEGTFLYDDCVADPVVNLDNYYYCY